ncbi:hypothetical protein LEP1GSC127_2849 [Leptospira kirschneri str. 200801925]|nr:hypothetical protein LEP1GSC127_2849 [Leptospira kirschneri str. 200801925]
MTPGILLLAPFPILFGSELGFGIGIFFSLRLRFHFYITI